MHRTFIALITASAMALTSLDAAPAAARDRGKTAPVVAGVALFALLAAAVAERKRHDQRDIVARADTGYHDRVAPRHQGHGSSRSHRRVRRRHEDGYRHSRRVRLPGDCRVRKGRRFGYSGRCLNRYDYGREALPSACAVRVGGRHRTIYRDRCLNGYGYY